MTKDKEELAHHLVLLLGNILAHNELGRVALHRMMKILTEHEQELLNTIQEQKEEIASLQAQVEELWDEV